MNINTLHPKEIIPIIKEYMTYGQWKKLKPLIHQLESTFEQEENTHLQFQSHHVLAKYYEAIHQYDQSASHYRKALTMEGKIDTNELSTEWIDAYLRYATLETNYKQFQKARTFLGKLLDWLDRNRQDDKLAYGLAYRNIGNVFFADDDYKGAIIQWERAKTYFEAVYPITHPLITETIQKISTAYINQENYDQARELYEHLLYQYEKRNDRINMARTLIKIGEIYYYTDLKKARSSIKQALTEFEQIEKGGQADRIKALFMLGEIDEHTANYPRSLNYYKKVLKQTNESDGNWEAFAVYAYAKIGMLHIQLNELDEAKKYLEQGLPLSKIFSKIRMQFLYGLGKIYSFEKRFDDAQSMYFQFLQLLESHNQKKSKSYADTLQAIAFNELQQERLAEALRYYKEAYNVYETLVSTTCREEKGLTCMRIAYCYEKLDDQPFQRAEPFYEKGIQLLKKGCSAAVTEEAFFAIIDFYHRTNQPKKKKKYEDEFVKRKKTE
ncbi:tetratricopeptide repeat protein [Fervidibacillus albus]|uniref:Tetratricopeptide repeat protein n=1 Tax=Fervidibacillus albus TaxID=2980026 RepID=A0A9E8LTI1_9BACI|nr:tetratricopeptide repeat protein [Fervidibacillus albus]WAA09334.1 tetratricopeptide repeat protein [Fervidibacillus albus]